MLGRIGTAVDDYTQEFSLQILIGNYFEKIRLHTSTINETKY